METLILGLKLLSAFIVRYFAIAGVAFLIFYIFLSSRIQKNKIQNQHASSKDMKREILYSLLANVIFVGIALILEFGPLGKHTLIYHNLQEFPIWYMPISVVLALIVHDTYFYWMHRLIHFGPLYKTIHKTHHLSTNPSPWAAFAFHSIESVLETLAVVVVMFVVPLHISMLLAFTTLSLMINVYGHLGYEIMPKWFRNSILFEVLNTSVHHNMHHKYFKGNYGLYFRVWDRLMGTENPNYVKAYDELQAQRFEETTQIVKA